IPSSRRKTDVLNVLPALADGDNLAAAPSLLSPGHASGREIPMALTIVSYDLPENGT
ncbi:hypothetical protein J6590_076118, partial [Homalodisca vitripennis]